MTRHGDTETRKQGEDINLPASPRPPISPSLNCAACGAEIGREFAKFCRVCGKFLPEDYQPLDTLRSSNRMQGKAIVFEKKVEEEEIVDIFAINKNARSQSAWASLVYSLVPYLGIIFIPMTFFLGISALIASSRFGGKKLALVSMALSLVVLAIQILLWWLLYIIPTLGR